MSSKIMEICPKCGKRVNPPDHFALARSIPLSQIECSCGYIGLPVEFDEEESK